MTSMQRGMTALLLLTLALPVASQAGPTQPTPSQIPSTWTQLVQDICGVYATFYRDMALTRDAGWSRDKALAASRQWDAAHQIARGAQLMHAEIIDDVYNRSELRPDTWYRVGMDECRALVGPPPPLP